MISARLGTIRWLQPQLDRITAGARAQVSPQHRIALELAQTWLAEHRRVEAAMRVGERASDFALPNQRGEVIRLVDRLSSGPVALVFFRGEWCPYCQATLRAWNRQLGRVHAAGGSVLAVSPQTPEANAAMAGKLQLRYELLSDIGSEISSMFRVSYPVLAEMKLLYLQFGIRLAEINGGDSSQLPMPATFLLDRQGVIRLSDVQCDPARRLEPIDAIRVMQALAAAEPAAASFGARSPARPGRQS
ncbi:MAG: peroxiredoxin-like family protein [Nevskia sp.]